MNTQTPANNAPQPKHRSQAGIDLNIANTCSAAFFDPRSPGIERTPPMAAIAAEKVAFLDPRSPNVARTPLLSLTNCTSGTINPKNSSPVCLLMSGCGRFVRASGRGRACMRIPVRVESVCLLPGIQHVQHSQSSDARAPAQRKQYAVATACGRMDMMVQSESQVGSLRLG